ncbi:MAG: hypothetical protein AAGK14_01570 [Verrucomicrobiota bacterium]
MARSLLALAGVALLAGCAGSQTDYIPNLDPVVESGGGGKVKVIDGIQMWRGGSPEKPYEIIGTIQDERVASPDAVNGLKEKVLEMVRQYGGDGVILVSSKAHDVTQQVTTAYPVYDPFMYGPWMGGMYDPAFGLAYYPDGGFFYPPTQTVTQNVTEHVLTTELQVFKYVK